MTPDPLTASKQDWNERGLELCDPGVGLWITDRVNTLDHTVAALLPDIFPAFARVFHPARTSDGLPVRWDAVARANGRHAHSTMEWGSIVGAWNATGQDGLWSRSPSRGSLPADTAHALADTLRPFTRTPSRCWFAHWEGSGYLDELPTAARLPMPGRNMVVFAGSIEHADTRFGGRFGKSAHLWWPDDHAWCVATDIDLMTTYVGATEECVDALLNTSGLEALPATRDQRLTWDSDTVNPRPESP